MKRFLSFGIILSFFSIYLQGQDVKYFGPKSGNFAVGIAANPFLEYVGNFFGKTGKNFAPTADMASSYHLLGKYFTSDNTAIRAGFNLDYAAETYFFGVEDANKVKETDLSIGFTLGLEKRVGSNRFYGFYGPSAGVGFGTSYDAYNYGEDPSTGDLLKESYGSDFSLSIGGFAGIEYFLCTNFAIGTEIGLGLNYYSSGKGSIEYEGSDEVETGSKSRGINFGFYDSPAQFAQRGTVYFSFYF